MAHFEINGERIYIDNRLKERIDRDILPDLRKKDMDVVFAVTGKERVGKSTFALQLGAYIASQLNVPFSEKNLAFTPTELRKKISNANKNDVIIYDEAHRGMASARSTSTVNVLLRDLFMEMGQLNLCVFVVMPSFFMLDKYIAIHRTRGLFYIYMKGGERGYWVYFGEKEKKKLYLEGKKTLDMDCIKWPDFRGRFTSKLPINEEVYRNLKRESLKKEDEGTVMGSRLYTRVSVMRDILLKILHKYYGLTYKEVLEKIKKEYDLDFSDLPVYELVKPPNEEEALVMQLKRGEKKLEKIKSESNSNNA